MPKWLDLNTSDALIWFSAVNQAELWAGPRPAEHDRLGELFGAVARAPADTEAARRVLRFRVANGPMVGVYEVGGVTAEAALPLGPARCN